MKERPLLFSGEMVRAILDGRKTQTRRAVKPAPDWEHPQRCCTETPEGWQGPLSTTEWAHEGDRQDGDLRRCRYGWKGDRLWVREAFQPLFAEGFNWSTCDWETGRGYAPRYVATEGRTDWCDPADIITDRCKPGIHMPRWASRIMLEVTGVRVERLQDISEVDAMREGDPQQGLIASENTHRDWYRALWERINGPGSWETNPWVWVVEFRRLAA